jgi:signal transduction histidine kinase
MSKRAIIFYWLLLLVPTMVICVLAVGLLRGESKRLEQAATNTLNNQARLLADTLQVTVADVKADFMKAMAAVPPSNRTAQLAAWQRQNFLVRNVFVWDAVRGLRYPQTGTSATGEERLFSARYEPFFAGRIAWPTQTAEKPVLKPVESAKASPLTKSLDRLMAVREQAVQMAPQPVVAPRLSVAGAISQKSGSGWIPWFVENRLHILGWMRPESETVVYGLELELMALLSLLVPEFGFNLPNSVFALMDGNGGVLHQTAGKVVESGMMPDMAISLAPHLPHWQVAVFLDKNRAITTGARQFLLLGSLLLFIFVAAVLAGGILLTLQVVRSQRDARQKTSFVSNVSHELKTPLTSIRMYAELLESGRVKEAKRRQDYLKVIADESKRLTRLVNNVLDFSRLEQGRKTYRTQKIKLRVYLKETIEAQKMRLEAAGMRIEWDLPATEVMVLSDHDALDQVFLNLIDNGIKYAAEGGLLSVEMVVKEKWVQIVMADRGPGVPRAYQRKIFERFQRVDKSLTAAQPGSGLGLSIALRLIRDQGGDLWYEKRDGGGSRFVIRLPLYNQLKDGEGS